MKKFHLFFSIVLVCISSCKNDQTKQADITKIATVQVDVKAKGSFEDLDGNPIELSDFKGKRVLLNYWATWCKPCVSEMPTMLNAQEILDKENYIFLLASDQSIEKIKAFQEKKKFDFTFLKFNGSLAEMKISALPATFIYNESGKLTERIDGATEWDSPKILDKLKAIK